VAQPEDSIPQEDLWPHIGEYDRWAIQWGYKYSGATDPEQDRLIVSKWATDSLASNPQLWFGTEEGEITNLPYASAYLPFDPRVQTECVGDNNMTGNAYGILNMKRLFAGFPNWDHLENGTFYDWEQIYGWSLWTLRKHWIPQVETYIGGRSRTYKSEDAAGDVYEPTAKALQKQAVAWLNEQIFNPPTWLMNPVVVNKIVRPESRNVAQQIQSEVLHRLLDGMTLSRLAANTLQFGPDSTYSLEEYFNDLHQCIWGNLSTAKPMDIYRRGLQNAYITYLGMTVAANNQDVRETDYWTLARTDLLRIRREAMDAVKKYPEGLDKDHLEGILFRIDKLVNFKLMLN
jgi:hypothetical protein